MRLQEKLDLQKSAFEKNAPVETLEVMHRATNDLKNSGKMDRVLKTGDPVPVFSLPDQNGNLVSSSALLKKGPLVIHFFRGSW